MGYAQGCCCVATASPRFFVRRLLRRRTSTPRACNNDRVCGGNTATPLCVQQYLVRLTTIACAAAWPPPYGTPALFQRLVRTTKHTNIALYMYIDDIVAALRPYKI